MRWQRLIGLVALMAACLGLLGLLTGCGGPGPKAEVQQSYLFSWFENSTVVNSEGERILGPGRDGEYHIMADSQGKQLYILTEERIFPEDAPGIGGQPWLVRDSLAIYDLQGRLLKTVQMEEGKTDWEIALNGDLQKSLFFAVPQGRGRAELSGLGRGGPKAGGGANHAGGF